MQIFLTTVFVFSLALSLWHFVDLMQFFQLLEYLNGRFSNWAAGHWRRVIRPVEAAAAVVFLVGLLFAGPSGSWAAAVGGAVVWLATAGISLWGWRRSRAQVIKPLVITARVKRLLAAGVLLLLVEGSGLFWLIFKTPPYQLAGWPTEPGVQVYGFLLGLWVLSQLTVVNIMLANLVTYPVEAAMRAYYVESARKIIREVNPIVIGITGSYGKTSTKEILAHILSSNVDVLKTPRTFNTILGVCKVIREDLKPHHKYFIVEMGAYKPGEIARICRLVRPQIGILTAVGPQHLERFKTIEKIIQAKYELIEALPPDGTAIFNGDDPICRQLASRTQVKTLRYGISPESTDLDLRAANFVTGENGTTFEILVDGRSPEPARTRLLGRHNITNTAGAILAALQCGVTLKEAVHSLASLTPLEHRLQLVRAQGEITYIDNAYNSNPSGAQVALEVLASFHTGRKILVTPGFAELGSVEAEEHARLGRNAAEVCDFIFLIGSPQRVAQIQRGIEEIGFAGDRVYCYNRLNDARPKLREILQPGDVVLFENDLPDTYS